MVRNYGYYCLSSTELNTVFSCLEPSDCPDMYAVLGNKIVIIEHFEFDASEYKNKKGLIGKREESHLKKRIEHAVCNNQFHIDKPVYPISLENWQNNFELNFNNHYAKIDTYQNKVSESVQDGIDRSFVTGFFVENQFSPYVTINGKLTELYYFRTKQFAEKILSNTKLDFVIFGSYENFKPQLTFIDRNALCNIQGIVDLNSDQVELSHLNQNEVVMYGKFSFKNDST